LSRLFRSSEFSAALAILILSLVFGLINPNFLSGANVMVMLRAVAYPGLIAVGMALALISGLIDLSVGSLAGLISCFVAWTIIVAGWPWPLAFAAGLGIGVASSLLNVTIILRLKITAFIATIGSMYMLRGLGYFISDGSTVYPLPAALSAFGSATPLGLTWPLIFFVVSVCVGEYFLRFTVWGLTVKATGSDREVASWTEVNVNRVNTVCFIILGFLTAVSGILITLRVGGGSPTAGLGSEFRAIVGCALGGVSLFGYEGSIVGAALGMILAQVLANGLIAIGMPSTFQDVALGAALIGVIALDVYRRNIKLPIMEKE
jgi:ribose transport system permease protein